MVLLLEQHFFMKKDYDKTLYHQIFIMFVKTDVIQIKRP